MRLHRYNIYVTEYLLNKYIEVNYIVKTICSMKVVSILMMNILIISDE